MEKEFILPKRRNSKPVLKKSNIKHTHVFNKTWHLLTSLSSTLKDKSTRIGIKRSFSLMERISNPLTYPEIKIRKNIKRLLILSKEAHKFFQKKPSQFDKGNNNRCNTIKESHHFYEEVINLLNYSEIYASKSFNLSNLDYANYVLCKPNEWSQSLFKRAYLLKKHTLDLIKFLQLKQCILSNIWSLAPIDTIKYLFKEMETILYLYKAFEKNLLQEVNTCIN